MTLNHHENQQKNVLKKELDTQLDVMVSAYLETLGLEKKIADEAIKGGSSITVKLENPDLPKITDNSDKITDNSQLSEEICITKEDESTGYKFSKPWQEFYDLLVRKIAVSGVIGCYLNQKRGSYYKNGLYEIDYYLEIEWY